MKKLKMIVVGCGQRGYGLSESVISLYLDKVEVIAACDRFVDRAEKCAKFFEEKQGSAVKALTDYNDVIAARPDCVLIATAWLDRVDMVCQALEAGIAVASEVGCAYNLDQCYKLVETWEKTRTPYMFMENCCYGHIEQLALSMKKQGLLGEIVHCTGGYCHDLRTEICEGNENRHYRFDEYRSRNLHNYPSHDLLPIGRVLDMNCGNRILTLTSTASKSAGLSAMAKEKYPADHPANNTTFKQGDIVTTVLKFANGETVRLSLDTTLPRAYSREFSVRGTKGAIFEDTQSVFLDNGEDFEKDLCWKEEWGNVEKYYELYDSEMWQEYKKNPIGSHDGMDYLVFGEFFDCLINNKPMPIDVYDAATVMAIGPLSEMSIENNGAVVDVPDFTKGKWIHRYYEKTEA